jgi:ElaB/YqjD/DUF883 family membrane-anchored ribosome-binding protein
MLFKRAYTYDPNIDVDGLVHERNKHLEKRVAELEAENRRIREEADAELRDLRAQLHTKSNEVREVRETLFRATRLRRPVDAGVEVMV